MEFEESIFNLIPKEAYVPPKNARHVSKHDPKCAPTSSTFGLHTTTKPGLANVTGNTRVQGGSHEATAPSATFGLPKGAAKPNAN